MSCKGKIIDLSQEIYTGMPVYPGDPEVRFNLLSTIRESGYNNTEIVMGSHTGTHIDSPRHCIHTDHGVDSFALEAMIGRGLPPKDAPILAAALAAEAGLLVTGDRSHFGHLFGRSIGHLLVQRPKGALSAIVLDAKRTRAPRDDS